MFVIGWYNLTQWKLLLLFLYPKRISTEIILNSRIILSLASKYSALPMLCVYLKATEAHNTHASPSFSLSRRGYLKPRRRAYAGQYKCVLIIIKQNRWNTNDKLCDCSKSAGLSVDLLQFHQPEFFIEKSTHKVLIWMLYVSLDKEYLFLFQLQLLYWQRGWLGSGYTEPVSNSYFDNIVFCPVLYLTIYYTSHL